MKQELFEQRHAASWAEFGAWLQHARHPRKGDEPPFPAAELPARYRSLCQQLALARDRDYSYSLVNHLHTLVQAGHDVLYRARGDFSRRAWRYARGGFAADVRANAWWVLAAALLLFGPALAVMIAVRQQPDFAYLVMAPEQITQFESMYSDDTRALGRVARDAATDFSMFGFYIFNNVSIAFRCFAGGITAGAMSAFALIFNGVHFGVVEARLQLAGLGHNFYSFVIGHSGFELGAIVLSGAAGLRLGMSLLIPGPRSRRLALQETGRDLVGMICGLAVMLTIAAMIEAFWSPLKLPALIKFGVGGVLCAAPILYFLLAGRGDGS